MADNEPKSANIADRSWIVLLDTSIEAAHDRYRAAQAAFLASPNRATAARYRQHAYRFWVALNRSSIGWDAELQHLNANIDRALAAAG